MGAHALTSDFSELLRGYDKSALEEDESTIIGLWGDLLGYVNRAYHRFAREEGARPDTWHRWGIGAFYLDAITGPIHAFYAERLANVSTRGRSWNHLYACHAPDVRRYFRLQVTSLPDGALLLCHRIVARWPCREASMPPLDELYRDTLGHVVQCSSCRSVRRPGTRTWDWVPAWVASVPAATSHGLCEPCLNDLYPELR